jgi:hypothetical protein
MKALICMCYRDIIKPKNAWLIINFFNLNNAVAIVDQQNFTIILSTNVLLWIKGIARYF